MPIEHRTALRDDGGRHSVVGTREGQSAQGEILLEETTISYKVA